MQGWVEGLSYYPVKSCRGVVVSELGILTDGPRYDREFVIVDSKKQFVTQRQYPQMATLEVARGDDSITLKHPGGEHTVHSLDLGAETAVTIWGQSVVGLDMGESVSEFLSSFLQEPVRLIRSLREKPRVIDKAGHPSYETRFTDQAQVLLILEESRRALSDFLREEIPADRFRSNILVSGFAAWSEETWTKVKIGSVEFDVYKVCSRCKIITIDQNTGDEKSKASLLALKNDLKGSKTKAEFGVYLRVTRPGTVFLTDTVEIETVI